MPPLSHRLLAVTLLSLSATAMAQQPEPPKGGPGAQGHHGRMTPPAKRSELKTMLEAHFDKLDLNHDGTLSQADRDLARTQHRDARFASIDANKDGTISKQEFEAARRPASFGHDGHGGDWHRPMMWRAHMRHMDGPGGPGPMGFMGGKDGKPVTKAAFVDAGLARFDKVDTNHDGTISQAERDAARAQMRDRRGRNDAPTPPPPPPGQ